MILALFFTLSRGGIAAGAIALAVYLACLRPHPEVPHPARHRHRRWHPDPARDHRYEFVHGFTEATARSQGNQLLWLTIAVCAVAGLAQVAMTLPGARGGWPSPGDNSRSPSAARR